MANFVTVVNDVMVVEGIISGDDDTISSFASTQHIASIRLAKKAVQQELAQLVSEELIPYEKTDAIVTVQSRTADLASNFVRMQDVNPWLVETNSSGTANGHYIWEYPGGEQALRKVDLEYREKTGEPQYWYWVGGSTKQLGFYLAPSTARYYRYYYEKDVSVAAESDTVPFVGQTEVEIFVEIAARRFKYMRASPQVRESLFPRGLADDPVIAQGRSTLTSLMRYKPPKQTYGRTFR